MEGRRFGIGIAAGLLLGFAVLTASGGLAAFSSGTSPASSSFNGPPAATTTASQAVTTATLPKTATSTGGQPAYAGGSSVTTTSTSPLSPSSSGSDERGLASTTTPVYSSRVQSIAHQPVLTDALVFVPALLALVLGAVIYKASVRSRQSVGEEPS